MNLLDYIQGNRKGKDANRLEREAQTDPFLSEALDGYIETSANVLPHIENMRNRITARTAPAVSTFKLHRIAAVLLILILSGTWYFLRPGADSDLYYKIFDEYTFSGPLAEIQPGNNKLVMEPVPLFSLPVALGGEEYVEPYLPVIKEKYDMLNIPSDIMKEGQGKKPEPAVDNRFYNSYLANQIQIPIEGACAVAKGKVILSFHVNPSGRPYNIRVVKGLCESLDNEAVRLVREGPDWKFGDQEVKMTIQL